MESRKCTIYFTKSLRFLNYRVLRYRDLCTVCNRARASCFCKYAKPFDTNTRFIILMHPREFKRQRTGTGRVTRLSLNNSEIIVGAEFAEHAGLMRILEDETYFPMLLFPGEKALDLSAPTFDSTTLKRRALVIIIDATWQSARKMLRLSPNLQKLPRISFAYDGVSRFTIKRQPNAFALSTIEAVYRILDIFNRHQYETLGNRHEALLEALDAIVKFQLECEQDPELPSHRLNTKKRPITIAQPL